MAHYEPSTGRIVAKSKIAYLHEYRHKIQHEKGAVDVAFMYHRWLQYTFFIFLGIYLQNTAIQTIAVIIMLPEMYLEIDAWIYALKKYRSESK